MTEFKWNHTPAPWTLCVGLGSKTNYQGNFEVIEACDMSEHRANARLIQKAPELLGVLEEFTDAAIAGGRAWNETALYEALHKAWKLMRDIQGTQPPEPAGGGR